MTDTSPFRRFAEWWAEKEVPMVLATSGPAARAVVLEEFDERGFCFWTSSESPTDEQLARESQAALVWLWDGRQARVEERVERVSDEENDRHWADREGKRQLVAFHQSQPVESREELVALLEATPDDPPRPPFWVGYRVVPERFEYVRDGDGWTRRRLQP